MRPPGMYKQDYLTELFARYGERDDTPEAPPLPDWCLGRWDSFGLWCMKHSLLLGAVMYICRSLGSKF
jgi:hypothetical protein